jgi:hypothetical protein
LGYYALPFRDHISAVVGKTMGKSKAGSEATAQSPQSPSLGKDKHEETNSLPLGPTVKPSSPISLTVKKEGIEEKATSSSISKSLFRRLTFRRGPQSAKSVKKEELWRYGPWLKPELDGTEVGPSPIESNPITPADLPPYEVGTSGEITPEYLQRIQREREEAQRREEKETEQRRQYIRREQVKNQEAWNEKSRLEALEQNRNAEAHRQESHRNDAARLQLEAALAREKEETRHEKEARLRLEKALAQEQERSRHEKAARQYLEASLIQEEEETRKEARLQSEFARIQQHEEAGEEKDVFQDRQREGAELDLDAILRHGLHPRKAPSQSSQSQPTAPSDGRDDMIPQNTAKPSSEARRVDDLGEHFKKLPSNSLVSEGKEQAQLSESSDDGGNWDIIEKAFLAHTGEYTPEDSLNDLDVLDFQTTESTGVVFSRVTFKWRCVSFSLI